MKGIIIYGDPMWGDNERATYCEFINNASIELNHYASETITSRLEGEASKTSKAVCSESDTYDFETGALIALMKMCGLEKSAKAYAEIFDDTAYGDALIERDKLRDEIVDLEYRKTCNETTIELLYNTINTLSGIDDKHKELEEENEKLKSDKDKSWKNYQRNIQKKQDRINELEAQITATEDDKQKNIEYYEKEIKKLKEENSNLNYIKSCNESTIESLENTRDLLKAENEELLDRVDYWKSQVNRLCSEKHRLEEKIENLELDCEKLRHGYLDTDMIFCGGRQNGKQYTLLVDLFKKIDQKKVDAAYKEAYNTKLPVWQSEFLKEVMSIRKENKEKTELPRTLDINGTKYRKTLQIKDYGEQISKLTVDSLIEESRKFTAKCVDEWNKPLTKREQEWERILALHKENDVIIEVKKEDVSTFLHEIEDKIPEIRWVSRQKIFEAKGTIKDIYETLKTCNRIYFRLRKENELSYSSDPHIYQYRDLEHISYLPPMRWDLFKKGRLAVKVNYNNYKEFYEKCESVIGRKPRYMRTDKSFTVYYKNGTFHERPYDEKIPYKYKVVNWEDVK